MKRYSPRSLTLVRTLFITAALVFAATPVVAQKIETGFLDRAVVVNKTEYRYQVFVPREFTRTKTWPVIMVLHGGGTYGSDGIRPTEGGLGRVRYCQTSARAFSAVCWLTFLPDVARLATF